MSERVCVRVGDAEFHTTWSTLSMSKFFAGIERSPVLTLDEGHDPRVVHNLIQVLRDGRFPLPVDFDREVAFRRYGIAWASEDPFRSESIAPEIQTRQPSRALANGSLWRSREMESEGWVSDGRSFRQRLSALRLMVHDSTNNSNRIHTCMDPSLLTLSSPRVQDGVSTISGVNGLGRAEEVCDGVQCRFVHRCRKMFALEPEKHDADPGTGVRTHSWTGLEFDFRCEGEGVCGTTIERCAVELPPGVVASGAFLTEAGEVIGFQTIPRFGGSRFRAVTWPPADRNPASFHVRTEFQMLGKPRLLVWVNAWACSHHRCRPRLQFT
jgi:hypothetical protein